MALGNDCIVRTLDQIDVFQTEWANILRGDTDLPAGEPRRKRLAHLSEFVERASYLVALIGDNSGRPVMVPREAIEYLLTNLENVALQTQTHNM